MHPASLGPRAPATAPSGNAGAGARWPASTASTSATPASIRRAFAGRSGPHPATPAAASARGAELGSLAHTSGLWFCHRNRSPADQLTAGALSSAASTSPAPTHIRPFTARAAAPTPLRTSTHANNTITTRAGGRAAASVASPGPSAAAPAAAPTPSTAPAAAAAAAPSAAGPSAAGPASGPAGTSAPARLQPVDFSTLAASVAELRGGWVPAKVEQVLMPDKTSLALRLRTPTGGGWLRLCWHPVAGRLALLGPGQEPERGAAAELYSFGEQVRDALAGRLLLCACMPAAWERVAELGFGGRPGEPPSHRLYCEVMARYSNIILTNAEGVVVAAAYQVGGMMSSLRQVQTGRPYALPPQLTGVPPTAVNSLDAFRDTLTRAAQLAAAAAAAVAAERAAAAAAGGSKQQRRAAAAAAAAAAPPAAAADDAAASTSTASATAGVTAGRLVDGFVRAFHGVSPALVEELCAAAGVDQRSNPGALDERQWAELYDRWLTWQQRLAAGDFAACSDPATGRFSVFGSLPVPAASVSALLEAHFGPAAAAEAHEALAGRLGGVVAGALKKARGKARAFQQQLADAGRAAEVSRTAEMITANIYRIPPGAASVEVEDWDTGAPLTLTLDPTQSPVQAAEALYRKARKLRRAVDAVQPLLAEAEAEAAYLEEVEVGLAALRRWRGDSADSVALREVQDELVAGKYMKPPTDAALAAKTAAKAAKAAGRAATRAAKGGKGAKQGGGKQGAAAALAAAAAGGGGEDAAAARRFTSPGGFTVLVGRNNKQNDILSTQVAADEDLWFHVRGMPGSHTLLRLPPGGKRQPEDADVQFAADLAAFFSKAKDSLKVDVVLSKGAWVRKPRGAKPGAVMVAKELRNVVARPGDSAAARADAAAGAGAAAGSAR
ncbi:hypothetical protein HYH03_011747 [Edaphochlamys debaryana]|uniref:NFACT RNA-binding domain-containing protein n=1 Tax=Edaphochlamys debaryana TaxID=47281 RepID=A0A835XT59_9CHLO|nr:hypothetical protein HYH03_011747 [Edaphochlamys debaryana]|eukprot:KAG2489798.1 hypothetical protein HYH03_011747 [Edaphochlamys debaryana]